MVMRVSVECEVYGDALLSAEHSTEHEGTVYTFVPREGRLASIRIERRAPRPELFFNVFERAEKGTAPGLKGRADAEMIKAMLEEFKQLESMLAFSIQIRKIDYESPTYRLIPETPEEEAQVQFNNIRVSPGKRQPATLTQGEMNTIVKARERYSSLSVIQAFLREGQNSFDDRNYISAFMSFFSILEDRYAPGEKSVRVVRRKFNTSPELTMFVNCTVVAFAKADTDREQLLAMLTKHGKQFDVEGIIYLMTETRGEVHHFVEKSRRQYGNPFRNKEYRALALAALTISGMIIHGRIRELNKNAAGA
jgi:hypothetical protein